MTLSFVSVLRDSYKSWLTRHGNQRSQDEAVTYLVKTHKDTYEKHQQEINRQWTAVLIIGGWARKLPRLPNGRQLSFDYGDQTVCCHVPESVNVGESEFPLLQGKREDWIEYLKAIDKHRLAMHRFFETILDPIFREHPGIDTSAAIQIAIERGRLREWHDEDEDGAASAHR